MKYLTVSDVILLHNIAIDETGGSHGLRDFGLLESAVMQSRASFGGKNFYPDIFLKTAALTHSLLLNHMFVDGNKRSAMFSAMTFLELNGYKFIAKQKEVVATAMWIANQKPTIEEIAACLKSNTKKRK